jgi:hypothetical protein
MRWQLGAFLTRTALCPAALIQGDYLPKNGGQVLRHWWRRDVGGTRNWTRGAIVSSRPGCPASLIPGNFYSDGGTRNLELLTVEGDNECGLWEAPRGARGVRLVPGPEGHNHGVRDRLSRRRRKRADFSRKGLSALCGLLTAALLVGCGGSSAEPMPPAAHSTANDFVIVSTGPESQRRVGPYRYLAAGTYANAVRVFGRPSSRGTDNPVESNICTVRWRNLGLDIDFATSAPKPCASTHRGRGAWYGITVYTRRWHTERGLRVGDREARIRRLYPRARFRDLPPSPPIWSLIRERRPDPVGVTDTLTAEVWGGVAVAIRIPPDYIY